ncbi:MAG: LuxR C-terminal-related transcriptional regulator [Anaerolineaceae bacterium]
MNQSDQVFTYKEMAELERRRLVAASLRSTLSALNSDLHIDKLLDFIVNQALPLLSADAVAIYRLNPDGKLSIQSVVGLPLEYLQCANVSLGKIATEKAILIKQPIFCTNLADILNEPGLRPEQIRPFNQIIKRYRSILSVPIEIHEESYGVMTLFFIKRHKLNDDELDLAIDFSIQAALAIENARLRLRAQQDAVKQERNRLSRELHDSVMQNLLSASLIRETLPNVIQRDPKKGPEGLNELRLLIRGALEEKLNPDVILMDLIMPNMDGLHTTHQNHNRFPKINIIALTSFTEPQLIHNAIDAGVSGYLYKDASANELANPIRSVNSGNTIFSQEDAQSWVNQSSTSGSTFFKLTTREREVLILMTNGKSNAEISVRLSLSLSTAKFHVSNILSKLNAHSRGEAVSIALKNHLVN